MATYTIGSGGDYLTFAAFEAAVSLPEVGGTTLQVTGTLAGGHTFSDADYANGLNLTAASGEEADGAGSGAWINGALAAPMSAAFVMTSLRAHALDAELMTTTEGTVTDCVFGEGSVVDTFEVTPSSLLLVTNTIMIDANDDGAFSSATTATVKFIRCSVIDAERFGLLRVFAEDCLIIGSGTDDFFSQMASGSDYNASSDLTAPGSNSLIGRTTSDLTNYAGGDYNLDPLSALNSLGSGGGRIGATLVPVVAPVLTLPTETAITDVTATVGATTDSATGTLYYYISTSATPPSASDLKAGTGSVTFGSDASLSVGANTFAATGLTASTTYYTYFIQNDGSSDSNILGSGSWATLAASGPTLTGPDTTTEGDPAQITGTGLASAVVVAVQTKDLMYGSIQTIDSQTATAIDILDMQSMVLSAMPGVPVAGIPLEADTLAAGATPWPLEWFVFDGVDSGTRDLTFNSEATHTVVQAMLATSNVTDGDSVLAPIILNQAPEDDMQYYAPKSVNGMNITWNADGTFTTDADQTEVIRVYFWSPASGEWGATDLTITQTGIGPVVTITFPTPSGVIGTETTATLGSTTDTDSGTFYGVVDTLANISGITASQVKAGDNNADSPAVAASNSSVTDFSPQTGVTGLTSDTAYSYALVQNSAVDSNLLIGSFTTASSGMPPVLTNATPSGTIGTEESVTVGADTDVNSGTAYAVVDFASELVGITNEQIKLGQNKNSVPAETAGFSTVTASPISITMLGLTENTLYSYVIIQSQNGDSNQITGTFTTAQAIVPTLSNPDVWAVGPTLAFFSVDTDVGSGTLYYSVTTSATPPSASDIKDGTGSVSFGNQSVGSTGQQNAFATGLTPLTSYWTHFIQDSGGDSNIVTTDEFTTTAASSGGIINSRLSIGIGIGI